MSTNHIRSKWAAVGAAIAVSLGAGGIGITQATTSSGEKPIYLPIEPCRLADTRAEFQVGPRSAPLGPNETYTLSGQGAIGNCNLPAESTALSLNVTAINASAPTFVSLFPAGAPLPVASHLNPLPGQGPVPNAVNVDLSVGGEFSIYNLQGNVDIFIDVVGIYDDHTHDDRYYTEVEADAALAALQPPNPFATVSSTTAYSNNTTAPTAVLTTSITVPDGYNAVLKADFAAESACGGAGSYCVVAIHLDGTEMAPADGSNFAFDTDDGGSWEANAITRTLTVGPGTYTVEVRARSIAAGTTTRLDESILFVEAFLQTP